MGASPGPTLSQIILARHVEAGKNLVDVHGISPLDEITSKGHKQATRLARRLMSRTRGTPVGIVAVPTPQAVATAHLLAESTRIPYEGELSLSPFGLGEAAGLSSAELRAMLPDAFASLDLFRNRVISASELRVPGAETASTAESRLQKWWVDEGRSRCPGRVVVGSNSTILMIAHFLNGILPTDPRYRYLGVPNGSFRVWTGGADQWTAMPTFPRYTWPDVRVKRLPSRSGCVAISRYRPSWAARSRGIIIVPGYFGSSRHGPYGLYSRLARAWAWEGYDVVCLDPLGSGDSTSVFRTFDTEVESVETVSAWLAEQVESLVIVGHSMGGATALQASRNAAPRKDAVWCLAPICRLEDLSRSFFSPAHMDELLTEGHTYRHGLELRTDFIRESGAAWEWHSHRAAALWLAGADAYTEGMSLSGIPPDRIFTIPGADHNFSTNGSAPYLIEATTQALIDSDPRIAEHL